MNIAHVCKLGASLAICVAAIAHTALATRSHVERIGATVLSAKTERLGGDRVRLSVTPKLESAVGLRLLDDAGKEVRATVGGDGAIRAEIDPRRSYVLAPLPPERRALPDDGLEFPARYVTVTPQGAANLGGLFLRPARVPLVWDEQSRAYATELFVGYEFLDGAERTLGAPKTVTFFAEGSNARIQADTVRVTKSGGSGYQRVSLFTNELDRETHFVARAGPADELKTSVSVRREPGGLHPTMPSTELAAFGVGSGTLVVGLLAKDGLPLAPAAPIEIQLSSLRLRHPASVTLPAGKTSVDVAIRSGGYGTDEIVASTGDLRAGLPVRMEFPVAALVAALIGGGMGGTARHFRRLRRRSPFLARRMFEGVVVGIILVGAAWAGLVMIDMSTGALGTPFGAFVLAALGGYAGCVLLDRIAGKTFGGLKPQT
jgi:hypothetical protein